MKRNGMDSRNIAALLCVIVLSVIFLITSLSLNDTGIRAANQSTIIATINITNSNPLLYNVGVSPSPVNLNPGNDTQVTCTAYFRDYDGWQDINSSLTNATLWIDHHTSSDAAENDNNLYRLSAGSCIACTQHNGGANNGTCNCTFNVTYVAFNGSWTCEMTINDNNFTSTNRTNVTINPLIAIDVNNSLHYGDLSVTETSPEREINITNFGNRPTNISVFGYGGFDRDTGANDSFHCTIGNITSSAERYYLYQGQSYADMLNISNTSTPIVNLTIPRRNVSHHLGGDTFNLTYWRVRVPLDVAGYCNGTIVLDASEGDPTVT